MTEEGLLQALQMFDTSIEEARVRLAAAEAVKDRLGAYQRDLSIREQALLEALDDPRMLGPGAFALQDLRLRHLDHSRRALQPDLADAAIDVETRREELRSALRIGAALQFLLEDLRGARPKPADEAAELLALRTLALRRQRTS